MSTDKLTETLKQYLLQNLAIQTDQKIIRKGKLRMFTIKQFHVKLSIDIGKNEIRQLELPYPFEINEKENGCTFNYHLSSFIPIEHPISSKIKFLNHKSASKFYNNVVHLDII